MQTDVDYSLNKGLRLLNIFERLNRGETIEKATLADSFGVTQKTIQRDISDIRTYLADTRIDDPEVDVKYDKAKNVYYLANSSRDSLTNMEVLSLIKVLLESRAFCKDEITTLIDKLLKKVPINERKKILDLTRNELHHYVPLRHNKKLFSTIWELSTLITENEIAQFHYTRQDGKMKERLVKPVAIMFSEFYFYLIAYLADDRKNYPAIFRVDRITNIKRTKEHFSIPYRDRFSDGEFRKRVQFMYSGELRRVTFDFNGPSLEAILDRLPTAEVIAETNGTYTIRAESYGNGIDMWLNSQGEHVFNVRASII